MAIQKWWRINSQFTIQHETIGSTKSFHSPPEKRFRHGSFHYFIKSFFIVVPLALQYSLELRDGPSVRNAWLVRTQSVRVASLLIVDVHFNTGENEYKKLFRGVTRGSGGSSSSSSTTAVSSSAFAFALCACFTSLVLKVSYPWPWKFFYFKAKYVCIKST